MSDSLRISDATQLRELTMRGIVLGMLITIVFTTSNVYLGLMVGLMFSSAIPFVGVACWMARRVQ